ncbi:glutamate synthase small subunit [Ahniella affigens]|uniref:Glutamate synthase small subunit n=1 Tax=Ahniella affigens TaxID=2021234 RepID=A0A2P1PS88_9GAMM|nr:FAD-dependent oxidoreductase [Ahniella affigens]AVP97707.1 glutamate synthase small subunit [Ahniella affigens]
MKITPFQFMDVPRKQPRELAVAVRVLGWSEIYGSFDAAGATEQSARCLDCGNPYCSAKCPVHNDIPNWLALVREGRLFEACDLAHETNPLPEICGRVCPQDRLCEGACTINVGFEAVTIGSVEKYIVDTAVKAGWRPDLSRVRPTRFKVAIIGAGPAGLACADRLARAGIAAHVFDRYEEIGGLLTFGIPPFKLEKEVIATRRMLLEGMGVQFHLGVEIGRDQSFETLLNDFDAVFIGNGAYRYVNGRLSGQDRPGVVPALPFLVSNGRRVLGSESAHEAVIAGWSHGAPTLDLAGKRVVVLGGGDTGMDCVRTAVRLGASQVTCVYRRDEASMPGSRREVKNAKDEGVQFLFNRQPLAILGHGPEDDSPVRAVQMAETEISAGSRSGGVQTIPGSEREIAADLVIQAFGFRAEQPAWLRSVLAADDLDAEQRVQVRRSDAGRRQPRSARLAYQTSVAKVFAGGDTVRGADLVVTAVQDGRDAAESIRRWLTIPQEG